MTEARLQEIEQSYQPHTSHSWRVVRELVAEVRRLREENEHLGRMCRSLDDINYGRTRPAKEILARLESCHIDDGRVTFTPDPLADAIGAGQEGSHDGV